MLEIATTAIVDADADARNQHHPSGGSAAEWAAWINTTGEERVLGIIETGRRARIAKDALGHGNFRREMFGKKGERKLLRWGQNSVGRFIAIAEWFDTNPVLSNSEYFQNMPESWGTLYNLTRLPVSEALRRLKDGTANPETGSHKHGRFAYLTGNDQWGTPAYIVEAARATMGSIDVDPASRALANKTVKATTYFTKEQNGLDYDWPGNVFGNPPYNHPPVKEFGEKLLQSYLSGITKQAVWVTNICSDTAWWQNLARHGLVCLLHKRVRFYSLEDGIEADLPAQLGTSIFYLGPRCKAFRVEFGELGMVMADVGDMLLDWDDDD